MLIEEKLCTKCGDKKPLTEVFWYKARPTATHSQGGWQSYCRECWKIVNFTNKQLRKTKKATTNQVLRNS